MLPDLLPDVIVEQAWFVAGTRFIPGVKYGSLHALPLGRGDSHSDSGPK